MSKREKLPSTTATIRETIPSEKQSPSFFNYAAIVIALVSLAGLAAVVLTDEVDPQVQANQDNITFMLIQINSTRNFELAMAEILIKQGNKIVNNTDFITDLWNYDTTITTQIGDIRADIKSKFPQASNVIDKGQSTTISGLPTLTLKMDKQDFFLGNVIFFTGSAHPNTAVQLTIKDPDRVLIPIAISRDQIIDGQYIANYTLRLDDPVGTWEIYARQQSDQTKTLKFTVE